MQNVNNSHTTNNLQAATANTGQEAWGDTQTKTRQRMGRGIGWSGLFAPQHSCHQGKTATHEDSTEASGIQLGKAIYTLNNQANNLLEFQVYTNV